MILKITLLALAAASSAASHIPLRSANSIEQEYLTSGLEYHLGEEFEQLEESANEEEQQEDFSLVITTRENPSDRSLAWSPGEPKTAWFMSFPGSGVAYFMHLIHVTTGRSTATNYGHSIMRRDGSFYKARGTSTSIYQNGPVYLAPYLVKKMSYVATRTHGDGYCLVCHPNKYFYSNLFWKSASGVQMRNGKPVSLQYDASQVKRMIHLIRNPFDVVVSRFHSHVGGMKRGATKPDLSSRYPLNPAGFKKWCKDQDTTYEKVELAWLPARIRGFSKYVPCRQEFMKYALFNTKVSKMAHARGIETLIVTYDAYFTDLGGTVKKVNNFLQLPTLPAVNPPRKKIQKFPEYYTVAEKGIVQRLLKNLIVPPLWPVMQLYMPNK